MTQLQESYLKLVNGQVDSCRKKHHLGGCISFSPLFVFKIFKKLDLQLDDPLESVLQCTCYNKGINYCQLCSQVFTSDDLECKSCM